MKTIIIKRSAFIVFFIALVTMNGVAQQTVDTIKRIAEIKKLYTTINSGAASYKVVKKDLSGQSAEGGELKQFFKGKDLPKASATFYGEMGQVTIEYYFKNAQLAFVYERQQHYAAPIATGEVKVTSVEENRYYFYNNKLIRWIGNDKKMVAGEKYAEKETGLLKDAGEAQQ